MSRLKIELDRSKEPLFFEDTFNDLSANADEGMMKAHLEMIHKGQFMVAGCRATFYAWLEQVLSDHTALILEMHKEADHAEDVCSLREGI